MHIGLLNVCADASSWWRFVSPLQQARKKGELTFEFINTVDWKELSRFDVVGFMRPFTQKHLDTLRVAKKTCPVWVDYDDNLAALRPENKHFGTFRGCNGILHQVCMEADLLTVSTPKLKSLYGGVVIPNAIDTDVFGEPTRRGPRDVKVIAWRGSVSHTTEVEMAAETFITLHKENPTLVAVFFGVLPQFTQHMDSRRIAHFKETDINQYFKVFREVSPDVVVIPLQDCLFNQCKSSIAWLETAWAGGVTIGPNYPEWERYGCLQYNDQAEMLERAREALYNPFYNTPQHTYRLTSEVYALSLPVVNPTRIALLKQLCRGVR